jgi:hypothetical protein
MIHSLEESREIYKVPLWKALAFLVCMFVRPSAAWRLLPKGCAGRELYWGKP